MQGSGWDSYDAEQFNIRTKAASLGSDIVVFAKPEKHVEHGISYQGPMILGESWTGEPMATPVGIW